MPTRTSKKKYASPQPACKMVDFTPDFVREAMEITEDPKGRFKIGKKRYTAKNNKTNRPFRPAGAKVVAQHILNGTWHYTGESMTFSTAGHVVSMQHRGIGMLMAEAAIELEPEKYKGIKLSFPQVLGLGVKPAAADYTDKGIARNATDVIFRHGTFKDFEAVQQKTVSNDHSVAQRLIWSRIRGKLVSRSGKQSHDAVMETLNQHPRLEEAVRYIYDLDSAQYDAQDEVTRDAGGISSKLSRGYAAALMYLFAASDDDRDKWEEGDDLKFKQWDNAAEFFRVLAEPYELAKGDPIMALINRRVAMRKAENSNRDEIVTAVVKAWNAWVTDTKIKSAAELKMHKPQGEPEYVIAGGLDIGPHEEVVAPDAD